MNKNMPTTVVTTTRIENSKEVIFLGMIERKDVAEFFSKKKEADWCVERLAPDMRSATILIDFGDKVIRYNWVAKRHPEMPGLWTPEWIEEKFEVSRRQ